MIFFDVKDQREVLGVVNMGHNEKALYKIADTVGISESCEIRIRLRDMKQGNPQGTFEAIAENVFRVVIYMKAKDSLSAKAHYVLNNSLVHELRHVAQYQMFGPWMSAMEDLEKDAAEFGRLARPDKIGTKIWALKAMKS